MASLQRIARREAEVRAWVHLDPEAVLRSAAIIDEAPAKALSGLTVGIKDIFDTADMPTQYGSPIYRGHRPGEDAAVVAMLKAAGALIVGKTETTEFAYAHPAPTRNPHDLSRTPGGSSSGSAAAVADGMVALAISSQTGGSTIRPASYCGIVGFKPTFGRLPTRGMKHMSPSLDTVGLHGRSVGDVARAYQVLAQDPRAASTAAPRIHFFPGPYAAAAEAVAAAALSQALGDLTEAGFQCADITSCPDFEWTGEGQIAVMAHEAAKSLQWEYRNHRQAMSPETQGLIEKGMPIKERHVANVLADARQLADEVSRILGDTGILLTFSAAGEAPALAAGTGSSVFNRSWTLLGLPAITIPFGRGRSGLPLGIQLVGALGRDEELLAAAGLIEPVFSARSAVRRL